MVANEKLQEQAKANSLDNYRHGFDPAFLDALVDLREGDAQFFSRAIEDPRFREFIADTLRPIVYQEQRARHH